MKLDNIVSITGLPGLHKLVASRPNGLLIEIEYLRPLSVGTEARGARQNTHGRALDNIGRNVENC